jgi:hypothetical protein
VGGAGCKPGPIEDEAHYAHLVAFAEALAGKRALNLRQIAALAKRFHVPMAVFVGRERRSSHRHCERSAAIHGPYGLPTVPDESKAPDSITVPPC